ncbi:hypothetical protein AB6A40_007578 [Gnathostoma spinigerum]|uniref:Uncharacterized protein n=1 Tax=Gnathostoma spinigerum TaxID=75299 RepID=A0ABD6EUA9_9BILA
MFSFKHLSLASNANSSVNKAFFAVICIELCRMAASMPYNEPSAMSSAIAMFSRCSLNDQPLMMSDIQTSSCEASGGYDNLNCGCPKFQRRNAVSNLLEDVDVEWLQQLANNNPS